MAQGSELERLETYVSKLLENYSTLKKTALGLQTRLKEKEEKIADLERQLSSLGSDQSEVSRRVNGLIGMIEEWEKEATVPLKEEGGENSAVDHQTVGKTVVEDSPESRQKNLFSME